MIIVDKALEERAKQGNPIRLALVGGGYSARNIAHQVISSFPGIQLAVIANRTPENARGCFEFAGVTDAREVETEADLERAISEGQPVYTGDADLACRAGNVDVVLEASGTIEFGAGVVVRAIENGKHAVLGNVELDATLGPILKAYADDPLKINESRSIKSAFYRLRRNPRRSAVVVDARNHPVGFIRLEDIARYIAKK